MENDKRESLRMLAISSPPPSAVRLQQALWECLDEIDRQQILLDTLADKIVEATERKKGKE